MAPRAVLTQKRGEGKGGEGRGGERCGRTYHHKRTNDFDRCVI